MCGNTFQFFHTHCDTNEHTHTPQSHDSEKLAARGPARHTRYTSSSLILRSRRWSQNPPALKLKRQHFVHYQYLPGLGFYGTGLIHLIGGLAKSATSILRQLVDAGTLSNLPAGLKARGLRIKGDDSPIMPGEFRDVDVPGGVVFGSGRHAISTVRVPECLISPLILFLPFGLVVVPAKVLGSTLLLFDSVRDIIN